MDRRPEQPRAKPELARSPQIHTEVSPLLLDTAGKQAQQDAVAMNQPQQSPVPPSAGGPASRPGIRAAIGPRHAWYVPVKATVEYLASLLILIPALPLIALSALAVKLTSRGPAFYTQKRLGRHGRLFTIYKIRTMQHDCESLTGPRWSEPGDPRVTPVGNFLRRTHLDELPQLLNILRGEMALIGPRPERPEFMSRLEHAFPRHRQRLRVRPGVTGLAQVQLAPDTDLESVRRKLAYDLHYVENLSPWLDARVLFATLFYTLGNPFRLTTRLRLVPTGGHIEDTVPAPVETPTAPAQRGGLNRRP